MLSLAGFADEISPDLDEQIQVCRECGLSAVELRSVENRNVLDFDEALKKKVRSRLRDAGLEVICIASPIGKVKITDLWEAHLERFKLAVESAEYFSSPFIRLFSYYPPAPGQSILPFRDEVIRRMRGKIEYLGTRPIRLLHENEKDIYGEKGEQCVDLMRSIESPKLRSAFDFANFVQAHEHPRDNWPSLKPYTAHIHIKDARLSDGGVVPAGKGDGDIGTILADAYRGGYRGCLSLEPHLAAHGQFSGFSGPKLFKTAVAALRELCQSHNIPLAPPK